MRELSCSWRALEGVGSWCCLGLCLPVGRAGQGLRLAQMREIRTGMPGDSVLWGE